jgi:dipeptidase
MNEHQLTIAETTFGGRNELKNNEGLIDYGSLIYIALQRSKTAREAIKTMTDLVEKYVITALVNRFQLPMPTKYG